MNAIQLDFFETPEQSEIASLHKLVVELKSSSDKVRKKCFAEIGKYSQIVIELSNRLEILERNICCGNIIIKKKEND